VELTPEQRIALRLFAHGKPVEIATAGAFSSEVVSELVQLGLVRVRREGGHFYAKITPKGLVAVNTEARGR
jgi:hypothetical protein